MKLNEIEKLKEVIFTPEQLLMFNFTPKPMISLDLNTKTINRSYLEQRSKIDTEDAYITFNYLELLPNKTSRIQIMKLQFQSKEECILKQMKNYIEIYIK